MYTLPSFHSHKVGTFNRTGQRYKSHFDIWTINSIQTLIEELRHIVPGSYAIAGWVNGNLYKPTEEVFGILPIPASVRNAAGLQDYSPTFGKALRHTYLAKVQNTRYAVIAVHTAAEREHFQALMKSNASFNRTGGPDWRQGTIDWNGSADGKSIFYKVR